MKVLDVYNERLNKFNSILGDYIKNCFKCLQFNNENNRALIFSDMEVYTGYNETPHFIENDDKYFLLDLNIIFIDNFAAILEICVNKNNISLSFDFFDFNLSREDINEVPNILENIASDIRLINSDNFHSKLMDFYNSIKFN